MMLAYPRHRRPASREAERGPGRPITVGRSHARLLRRREIHLVLKEAARLVKVKHGDTVEAITKHEAIVRRLFQMGMEGNIAAARLALFRLFAEPSEFRRRSMRRTVSSSGARFQHLLPPASDGDK